MNVNVEQMIDDMMNRARTAQKRLEHATQEEVDTLCAHIAWAGIQEDFVEEFAALAVEETGLGRVESKKAKIRTKTKGVYRDLKGKRSVGIIEEDLDRGIVKIAKPVGVIGALIPCTNPEATPFCKALAAIKTRNAIIMAPHPRAVRTGKMAVDRMRKVLESFGYPADLIQVMEKVSVEASGKLMEACDLIIATGGGGMVKAAYSSGTPAYGVGAGNAVVIVDETAIPEKVADDVRRSKTFDYATSCSAENSLVIEETIYDRLVDALTEEHGYLLDTGEKGLLQKALWPDGIHLNREVVAQPASRIAELAGITIPEGTEFLMVEETGFGSAYPFSGEKLSVVLTLYRYTEFIDAVGLVKGITAFSGAGHSCGMHTADRERAVALAEAVPVSRVMINQPQCLANSGAWSNGMPMTLTLGCGTWGGNISSENIGWKQMMNTTWVSFPIEAGEPDDRELFGEQFLQLRY